MCYLVCCRDRWHVRQAVGKHMNLRSVPNAKSEVSMAQAEKTLAGVLLRLVLNKAGRPQQVCVSFALP